MRNIMLADFFCVASGLSLVSLSAYTHVLHTYLTPKNNRQGCLTGIFHQSMHSDLKSHCSHARDHGHL